MENTPTADNPTAPAQRPEKPASPYSSRPHSSRNIILILGVIVFVLLIVTGASTYYFGLQNKSTSYNSTDGRVSPTPTRNTSSEVRSEFASWKAYSNSTIGLSLRYPPSWKIEEKNEAEGSLLVTISGSEGRIGVLWTTGLGGGCDTSLQTTVKLAETQRTVCMVTDDINENTVWSWYEPEYSNRARVIEARIPSVTDKNRSTIMQILSTVKFSDQTTDTTNWKIYTSSNYSFKYPADWSIRTFEYQESVTVLNPNKTVSITLSKGQYPYGFESPENKFVSNNIKVSVGDTKINTTERVVNNQGAYVDFAIGDYNILYGTDYPALDTTASLTDYNASKETIKSILSTFKFTE